MTILDQFRLDGKIAMVTGGSRGIGLGIARAFAEAGATIVLLARRPEVLQDAIEEIELLGKPVLGIAGDILVDSTIPNALDQAIEKFGQIDIMVNNAGGSKEKKWHSLGDVSLEAWDDMIAYNMRHKFWGSQQAARRMSDGGRIINIVTRAAFYPSPGTGTQAAANMAVVAMTRTLAEELAPRRITANCVAPGVVYTDQIAEVIGGSAEDIQSSPRWASPLGRIGRPSDIAAAALYFASPAAEWTTGQCLIVAGGR